MQWGMVWFFTQTVMAVAFPFLLGVLPMHAYRHGVVLVVPRPDPACSPHLR